MEGAHVEDEEVEHDKDDVQHHRNDGFEFAHDGLGVLQREGQVLALLQAIASVRPSGSASSREAEHEIEQQRGLLSQTMPCVCRSV